MVEVNVNKNSYFANTPYPKITSNSKNQHISIRCLLFMQFTFKTFSKENHLKNILSFKESPILI